MQSDTKICTSCAQKKFNFDFKKEKRSPTGYASLCKECHSKKQGLRYKENKPEYVAKERRIKTLAAYGLTLEDYDRMLKEQEYKCCVCGIEEKYATKQRFHVDHDHETGKVRGLLCGHCNKGLGLFRDSSSFLKNAAKYLEKFGK